MKFMRRDKKVISSFTELQTKALKSKALKSLVAMGPELVGLKYVDYDNWVLVPAMHKDKQFEYMETYRKDLFEDGLPLIEEEKYYSFVKAIEGMGFYESASGEIIQVEGGWPLSVELYYKFTSIRRAAEGKVYSPQALAEVVANNNWIFAKTMPENPHEYALRKAWNPVTISFDEMVLTIRRFGYTQIYGGRPYVVLDIGDHFYWTMGSPLAITILINRKVLHGGLQ